MSFSIRDETLIEKDIAAIFANFFCLERANQLSRLPDKDLVDLCPLSESYQVTKSLFSKLKNNKIGEIGDRLMPRSDKVFYY